MENDRAIRTAVNKVNVQNSRRDREIDDALGALMQHAQGRRLINWVLGLGKMGRNPFNGNALNTSFQCGELNVAQQVLERLLRVSPDSYLKMLKEQENERLADNAILDAARGDPADGDASDD